MVHRHRHPGELRLYLHRPGRHRHPGRPLGRTRPWNWVARTDGALEADASAAFAGFRDSYAQYGDAAIVVLCRQEGEGSDLPEGSLALTEEERALIAEAEANFEKGDRAAQRQRRHGDRGTQAGPAGGRHPVGGRAGYHGFYGVPSCSPVRPTPPAICRIPTRWILPSSPAYQNAGDFTFANAEAEGLDSYGSYYIVQAEGIYLGYQVL